MPPAIRKSFCDVEEVPGHPCACLTLDKNSDSLSFFEKKSFWVDDAEGPHAE